MENVFKNDKKISTKIAMCYLIIIIASLFVKIFPLLVLLINLIFAGYFYTFVNARIFKSDAKLPEWKEIGKLYLRSMPVVILFLAAFLVVFLLTLPLFFTPEAMNSQAALAGANPVFPKYLMKAMIIQTIISNIYWYIALSMILLYTTNLKFKSLINLKGIKHILITNWKSYLIFYLKNMLLQFFGLFVAILLCITVVGIFVGPIWIMYFTGIAGKFWAEFIRKTFNIKPACSKTEG